MHTAPDGRPGWVLAGSEGHVGDHFNERTATGFTRQGLSIKATFFFNRPPQPSKLCVHCPGAEDVGNPRVLCVAGDLILFRVAIATAGGLPIRRPSSPLRCEYFVYRADPNRPMLKQLPRVPNPSRGGFHDDEVSVLPRGDDDYTIAALDPDPCPPVLDKFELLLLRSETWSWTSMALSAPKKKLPFEIPMYTFDLSRHLTTNVIMIGGEHGTMGWVDLFRGILLCDVLSEKPLLRGVPVPLPMDHITGNDGEGYDLDRAMDCRGIAFTTNGCLKFVELHRSVTEFSPRVWDEETGLPKMLVHDWTITAWSNEKMSDSYDDWHKDGEVQASSITINNHMLSPSSGLLLLPPQLEDDGESVAAAEQHVCLRELAVSDPSPSMDGDGVVYLVARVKFGHRKSWIIAVDMKNNTLQSVVPLGIQEDPGAIMYCTSSQ